MNQPAHMSLKPQCPDEHHIELILQTSSAMDQMKSEGSALTKLSLSAFDCLSQPHDKNGVH